MDRKTNRQTEEIKGEKIYFIQKTNIEQNKYNKNVNKNKLMKGTCNLQ